GQTLRELWSGAMPGASGFLRPIPQPPILIAAFGPKMADLAGRVGDGLCAPANVALPELVAIARDAHARAGRDPQGFLVAGTLGSVPAQTRPCAAGGRD